jgi:hypothetical protein
VQWYARDLSVAQQIPFYPHFISRSGGTIASLNLPAHGVWTIYRVSSSVPPAIEKIGLISMDAATGKTGVAVGYPEALSDERVVSEPWSRAGGLEGTVQIESLDGRVLSSFKPKWLFAAEFASKTEIYLVEGNGQGRIVDFHGRELVRLRNPGGDSKFDERLGWSADGSRLLYGRYTRKSSAFSRIGDDAAFWASAPALLAGGSGIPFPYDRNQELVRVFDTASGKTCFDWKGLKNDIDKVRQYHADISPDGKRVAVLTPGTLAVYAMPARCTKH